MFRVFDRDNCFEDSTFTFLNPLSHRMEIGREVNKMAELGTQLAHVDGGVPNMRLIVPEPVSYTHLDVYKRQELARVYFLSGYAGAELDESPVLYPKGQDCD